MAGRAVAHSEVAAEALLLGCAQYGAAVGVIPAEGAQAALATAQHQEQGALRGECVGPWRGGRSWREPTATAQAWARGAAAHLHAKLLGAGAACASTMSSASTAKRPRSIYRGFDCLLRAAGVCLSEIKDPQ